MRSRWPTPEGPPERRPPPRLRESTRAESGACAAMRSGGIDPCGVEIGSISRSCAFEFERENLQFRPPASLSMRLVLAKVDEKLTARRVERPTALWTIARG